jgi:hypothetical protein
MDKTATAPVTTSQPLNATPAVTPVTPVSSNVPKVPTTAPTNPGVATSDLANTTLATQQNGTNNIQQQVAQQATTKAATPALNPTASVTDLLTSKGMPSDFNSRSQLAAKAGITGYVGTAAQNQQLMGYINNPPAPAPADTTVPNATVAATDADGNPTTAPVQSTTSTVTTPTTTPIPANDNPSTGTPGDIYDSQIQSVEEQQDTALQQRNAQVTQIMNGTFPLTASQQASINATQAQFNQIAQLQLIANKSYQGAVALAGNREGLNIQNPQEYFAQSNQAITDGLNKINNLDATAAVTLSTLTQSFMDKDYTLINDNYTALQKTLEDKQTAITALQTRTDDMYKYTQDYNQKAQEFTADYNQKQQEFSETQAKETQEFAANFNAQYGGLLDPQTGLVNTPPGQTPVGYLSSLGIGGATTLGGVGSVIDTGSAAYKALPTGVQRIMTLNAQKSGALVIDTSTPQGKSVLDNASAIQALSSLPPNQSLADAASNPGLSGILQKLTGFGESGSVSKLLGNVSVPNIKNMSVGQATYYLQNQIANTTGLPVQAVVYNDNPGQANTDLQTYHDASTANAQNAVSLAKQGYTPAQILQIVNYVPPTASAQSSTSSTIGSTVLDSLPIL